MTPFEPTEDQRAIGALAREIAAREIAPHIAGWDREHTFPRALYTKLNAAGLMGLLVPEAYGGSAADYVSYALMIEEVARVDAGTATTLKRFQPKARGSAGPILKRRCHIKITLSDE